MQVYYFSIRLSYDECERLYLPGINAVILTDEQGKRVQIPTKNLRPFVSPLGIAGRFRLLVDQNNKLKSFEKMA